MISGNKQEELCEGWIVSSESCSFQSVGAKYYREVFPGMLQYMYIFTDSGFRLIKKDIFSN